MSVQGTVRPLKTKSLDLRIKPLIKFSWNPRGLTQMSFTQMEYQRAYRLMFKPLSLQVFQDLTTRTSRGLAMPLSTTILTQDH